ncbi:MAG: hypothetical protein C0517_07525 [Erythrobacter sp.]|nr:hypothetical protein [Erythrobacter sp.]
MAMTTTTSSIPAFRFHPLIWGMAAAALLVPAAAMLVTREVNWGAGDFMVFGVMLAALCMAVEAACHWLATPLRRVSAIVLAVLAFLIVWAELAVGLFD